VPREMASQQTSRFLYGNNNAYAFLQVIPDSFNYCASVALLVMMELLALRSETISTAVSSRSWARGYPAGPFRTQRVSRVEPSVRFSSDS
jgi:hypothetical protein